jgi:hypothetical protein
MDMYEIAARTYRASRALNSTLRQITVHTAILNNNLKINGQ